MDCDDWIDWCGCVCTALDRAFSAGGVLWGWHHHHDYENVRLENDHDYGNVRLESDFDFGNVHLENVRDYGNVRLENDFEKSRNDGLGHGIVFDRHQIALEIVSLLLRWEREGTHAVVPILLVPHYAKFHEIVSNFVPLEQKSPHLRVLFETMQWVKWVCLVLHHVFSNPPRHLHHSQ